MEFLVSGSFKHVHNKKLWRPQGGWDSNSWALSLRSDFSPRITAP